MKQRSLIVAAVAMMPFAVAVAQTPPTPPVSPTPAAPLPAQAPTPLTPLTPMAPLPADLYIDRDAIRRAVDEARWQGQFAAEEGRRFAEEARRMAEDFKYDFKLDAKDFKIDLPKFSQNAFMGSVPYVSGHVEIGPPPSFGAQGDPADSLYQLGREAMNRQDYSRAAARFAELITKYPQSRVATQAAYWQAYALHRVGTLDALRTSLKVLEANAQRFEYDYNRSYRTEAPALQARVLRALADRGESGADGKLRELVAKYPSVSCDQDKIQIQRDVLNSLYQTDPEAAAPYIRQYLATRDACTAKLRQTAIFLLANRGTDENTALIVTLAKNDTVRSVRAQAIEVLSRMPGDAAIAALQQFMSDSDEQIQTAAIRSLMRSDNPKARAAMRALIDRREASERQRLDAIRSFDRDNTSPEDAAYLRALFNRPGESDRIKDAVIQAIGQTPTEENIKFLLDVAKNQNETSSIRSNALRRVTSRQNLTTDELIRLYDASDSPNMRRSLVDALGQRPEPVAVNKLLEIVKLSTDTETRSQAIQILLRKNDKTITQKVLDLIK